MIFKRLIIFVMWILPLCESNASKSVYDSSFANPYFEKATNYFLNSNFDSAIVYFEKCINIYIESGDIENYLASITGIANSYQKKRQFKKGISYIEKAEQKIMNSYIDHSILSEFYFSYGNILQDIGKYHQSIDIIIRAIDYANTYQGGKLIKIWEYYNIQGINYQSLKEYSKGIKCFHDAINLHKQHKQKDNKLITYYSNISSSYTTIGDYKNAELFISKAMIYAKEISALDSKELAYTYSTIGELQGNLGNYTDAIYMLKKAEEIYITTNNRDYYMLYYPYYSMGNIYYNLGDFIKAERYYTFSLKIAENSYDSNSLLAEYAKICLGNVYFKKKNYQKALMFYQQILTNSESNIITDIKHYIVRCFYMLNDTSKADQYFKDIIFDKEKKFGKAHFETGNIYHTYGRYCYEHGKEKLSYFYLISAKNIFVNNYGIKHPKTAQVSNSIGEFFVYNNNIDSALFYFQKSLIALVEKFEDNNKYENPKSIISLSNTGLVYTLKFKASALHTLSTTKTTTKAKLKDLKACLATYELAIRVIDKLRNGFLNEESKLFLMENEQASFISTVNVASELFGITGDEVYKLKAFEYAERSKAATLLSITRGTDALQISGIPDSVKEREKDLRQEIAFYEKTIYDENLNTTPNHDKLNLWNTALFELSQEQEKLIASLERDYPQYYALKYNTRSRNISEIRAGLDKNQALVEYVMGDSTLFCFVVTRDNFEMYETHFDSSFTKDIDKLISFLSKHNHGSGDDALFNDCLRAAANIYKQVLGHCDSLISGKKLIIIPDGKLSFVPFSALLTEMPPMPDFEYKNLPWLVKKHAVSYSYSATLLFNDMKKRDPAKNELLAFAPSYSRADTGLALPELKGAMKELHSIFKVTGDGVVYSSEEATEKAFKEVAGDYRMLHLVMHGITSDENPLYSRLIFTQTDDTTEDGQLNTSEIYSLGLRADMVVLSGCRTGDGELRKGEGIMSLARGFMYTGCPSIIMTLWTVGDDAGAQLMEYFYGYLKEGYLKDEALQMAQLEYMKNSTTSEQHPFFWAGFVNIGETAPVYDKPHSKFVFLCSLVVMLMIVIIAIKRRKRKKRNLIREKMQ